MARIGFIGLGNMGCHMAINLVKAGHDVVGFDLVKANLEQAEAGGVSRGSSTTNVAESADVIVTMLPAGKDVLAVYNSGLLNAAPEGALFIDSSTVDVESARTAHALAGDAACSR